jgi:predicted phage terminase large subunit-like protein
VRHVWPWFRVEEVHLLVAAYLEQVAFGVIDRLMVFMPPRAGKSMLASVLFPAWYLGQHPDDKTMLVMYASDLARKYGRQVRDLMRTPEYADVFPTVRVSPTTSAMDAFTIHQRRGEYNAFGLGAGIAGNGWNLGIIDDPLSEQDAFSQVAKDYAWDWYGPGFYTRRQPERSSLLYMGTRWAHDDLAGHLLDAMKNPQPGDEDFVDRWTICDVPAILDGAAARRLNEAAAADDLLGDETRWYAAGDSYSPRRWPVRQLLRQRAQMSEAKWLALYMQSPTADEGAIIKRSWWRQWPHKAMPKCELIVQIYDTAFEEREADDYSARTTWGVFVHEDRDDRRAKGQAHHALILLERWKDRVGFPELRLEVVRAAKEWQPDMIVVEGKASGKPIVQELRRLKQPVREWSPLRDMRGREMGKIPRTHAASVVWEQGGVFYPRRRWADEVIDECARFPAGEHDDVHDTCVIAALWLRRHFWAELVDELPDEEEQRRAALPAPPRRLYG